LMFFCIISYLELFISYHYISFLFIMYGIIHYSYFKVK